jgi:hypothetical protein
MKEITNSLARLFTEKLLELMEKASKLHLKQDELLIQNEIFSVVQEKMLNSRTDSVKKINDNSRKIVEKSEANIVALLKNQEENLEKTLTTQGVISTIIDAQNALINNIGDIVKEISLSSQQFRTEFPDTLAWAMTTEIQPILAAISQLSKLITDSQGKTKIWRSNILTKIEPLNFIFQIAENQLVQNTSIHQILNTLTDFNTAGELNSNIQKDEIISKILELNDNLVNLNNSLPNDCSYLINAELNVLKDQMNQLSIRNNTSNSKLLLQSNNIMEELLILKNQTPLQNNELENLIGKRISNINSSLARNINTL